MKHAQADYITAGYKFERAMLANKSANDIIAQSQAIRIMLEAEAIEDHQEARYLVERGRQEAREVDNVY